AAPKRSAQKKTPPPAFFKGRPPIPFIGKKVPHRGEQKRTESAPTAIGISQIVLLDKASEEFLGQMLRGVGIIPIASYESVNRSPIDPAESGQRLPCFLGVRCS